MKYYVWKKRFFHAIFSMVMLDAIFIAIIVLSMFFLPENKDKSIVALIYGILLVAINTLALHLLLLQGSLIVFEATNIKCLFLKQVRRTMSYSEIKDYGAFWTGKEKFIYISRFELTETQRNAEAFILYKKTKDVLVLQYHDEIIDFMKKKCPHINAKTM